MRNRSKSLHMGATALAAIALGYGIARVQADGAPTRQSLFYAGAIEENGNAPTGERAITLQFYLNDTTDTVLCSVTEKANVNSGRFRMSVGDQCTEALRKNADAFVRVSFEDSMGTPHGFERVKIGAVPYAMEAQHALRSDVAAAAENAAGELARKSKRIAVIARSTGAQGIPDKTFTTVEYLNVLEDSAGAFDSNTSLFTAPEAGCYSVNARILWDNFAWTGSQVSGLWLYLNGIQHFALSATSGVAQTAYREQGGSGVVCMTKGETLSVRAYQDAGAERRLYDGNLPHARLEIVRMSE